MRDFIRLPESIYADDPNRVPPLRAAERSAFLRMRNALEKLGLARIKTYRVYEKGI